MSGSPESVEQALALINALPKPTSLACLLQSLDRPLRLYATRGTISAQPAQGARSPRIFLFSKSGSFLMSVVPDGPGAPLLEFGEEGENGRSVKGELAFPINGAVARDAPFTRVMTSDHSTSCGLCHPDERPVPDDTAVSQRYSSLALRPVPTERVSLPELRAEWQSCDAKSEPDRCALLDALFSSGETTDAEFRPDLPTIVQ